MCDGAVYNISTYPALFAAIGNTYGGDGIVNFAVPDMRGRIPLGKDDMGGVAASRVVAATPEGSSGGAETHTLSINEMPIHDHAGSTDTAGGHTHSGTTNATGAHAHSTQGGGPPSSTGASGSSKNVQDQPGNTGSAGTHSHIITMDPVAPHVHTVLITVEGGDLPHNNVQPYITVNYIIKAT